MPTENIVNYILECSYEDLSEKTRIIIRNAFKDTIAVTIAAENKPLSFMLRHLNEELYSESNNTTFVNVLKNHPSEYAFLFGTMSHLLDYDDVNFTFYGHPSVTLIPIILALAKEYNLSGKKMIEAYAIGFEVQARIGECMGSEQYQKGWHTTSTVGIYGAVSAVSKILSFNEKQIKNAIGLASSFASGTRKNFGTMTKPLHVGLVARNAYLISKLVKHGVTGNQDIFSAPLSIDSIMTNKNIDFSPLKKLGVEWEIEQNGIIFKKYPCCAFTHRSIDAVLDIVTTNEIQLSSIEKIDAFVHHRVPKVLIYEKPESTTQAQFSLFYCLGAAFIDKKISLSTFTEQSIKRESIDTLMEKIHVKIDPSQEESVERYSTIQVYTNHGVFDNVVEFQKGHPQNPLTEKEFSDKFNDCLKGSYDHIARKSIYNLLSDLDNINYIDLERLFLQIK